MWRQKGIRRRPEELIHIDGDIKTVKIAHRLHDISFTTIETENGVSADPRSPCAALAMANGYNGNGIFFDYCFRREVVDLYILACHEGCMSQIRNHMHAPVEIVDSIPTWERI